jgi:hypothetical protein
MASIMEFLGICFQFGFTNGSPDRTPEAMKRKTQEYSFSAPSLQNYSEVTLPLFTGHNCSQGGPLYKPVFEF